MLGTLNNREIIDLLESQIVGRLGCHADGDTYIVPINYVYNDNSIYAHSANGKKLEIMRKNPKVCFQIDEIADTFRWKSVIISGVFEELTGEERQQALQGIIHKIMPRAERPEVGLSHAIKEEKRSEIIVFRIKMVDVSGRFESH